MNEREPGLRRSSLGSRSLYPRDDKVITKVMVLTFLDGSMEDSQLFFVPLHPFLIIGKKIV